MKILQLTFKNINNLKGEHAVSFDQAPLDQAGIFAITGPTGSGKSTLLDVITLALFNKVPRFKNAANNEVSITKKQIQDHGSIMTHHTDESYASIKYEINGHIYTSSWSVSKARTGNLRDYEMTLYDAAEKPFDLKKSEIPGKNEEIIGLNYAQFVKSIILSQGEFSKFLKAEKNERGRLLENITGTSIYRKIGIAAFEKEKEVREQIQKEKEIIGVIEVLSKEDLSRLNTQVTEFQSSKNTIDRQLKVLIDIQKIKKDLIHKTKDLYTKEETTTRLNEQKVTLAPFLERLDKHERLSPVQGKMAIYNEALVNKSAAEKNLIDYKNDLQKATTKLEGVISEMSQLTGSKIDQSNFKVKMSSFEKEVNDLDRDLRELRDRGSEERSRINAKLTDYPISISDNAKPGEAIALLSARQSTLEGIITSADISSESTVTELRSRLKKEGETLQLLQELQHQYTHKVELQQKNKEAREQLNQLKNKEKQIAPSVQSAKELINTIKENINLLRQQKLYAERIAKLEDIRQSLEDGKPCPLCGALDHPYTQHLPPAEASEIDLKIKAAEINLNSKEEETNKLEKEDTEIKTSRELLNKTATALEKEIKEVDLKIEQSRRSHNSDATLNMTDLNVTISSLQIKGSQLEDGIHAIEEKKLNLELQGIYSTLDDLLKKYVSKNQRRKELYQGNDITQTCNALQDQYEQSKTSIDRLQVSVEKEDQDLQRDTNIVSSIHKELLPQISEIGFNSIEEANSQILSQEEYEKVKWNKEELSNLITANNTELSNIKKEIGELSKKDTKADTPLDLLNGQINKLEKERDDISTQIGAIQSKLKRDKEDRARVAAKEKEIEALNAEFEKWSLMKKMIGDANGNTFANFAQGLTLQNLLVYANRRLKNLSDRYLLDMPSHDGALNIVDLYQGNIHRAVTTLSGGESFLISLALALSLSDMASKNVALDSLFIDEGFGTLDQETLEIAIDTLERLQSESQKTVGVISHVAALKERIAVQIKLHKNAQGYSRLEVVG